MTSFALPEPTWQYHELSLLEAVFRTDSTLGICKWCGSSPDNFMLPLSYLAGSQLFCPYCGRYTSQELGTNFLPKLILAWCDQKANAHKEVIKLFRSRPEYAHLADLSPWGMGLQLEYSYLGRPQTLAITYRDASAAKDERTLMYDWQLIGLIQPVLNEAVVRRLGTTPHFDLRSREACQRCGAGPNTHEWRNFSHTLRTADIYCGSCGVYIREWDPN